MTVHFETAGHVARVTIDRPERLNAVDAATEAELLRVWTAIEQDRSIWCVVLTGAGDKAFCVGADVHASDESGKSGLEYWAEPRPGGFGGLATRTSLHVPVIARVNGYAFGGGFEMLLGCDLAVACEEARFGLLEPRLGYLPLDGGMVLLARQIPAKQAMSILLTGRKLGAAEAERFGLVNEVVARAELDAAVERWVEQVLACAPRSLRAIKQTVKETAHLRASEALALRTPALVEAFVAEDREEGVRAFREKRKPRWSGK